jgi:predicted enzyme related to lactoylglutathione lyase
MPIIDSHLPGTPTWVDLMTKDLEKARAFYGGLFGWEFSVGPAETGFYTMCTLKGRNVAGMGQLQEGAPFPAAWSLYFGVESLEHTISKINARSGTVLLPPLDVMTEGRMAVCADSTGAAFGLWEPRRHRGATLVEEPGCMTWHEVNTRQVEKARDFYAMVFDLTPHQLEGMNYFTLSKGDKPCCGVMQMNDDIPESVPPHWINYFAVASADLSTKKVRDLGGRVAAEPFDTPYGRISFVSDSSGVNFAIVQLPPQA